MLQWQNDLDIITYGCSQKPNLHYVSTKSQQFQDFIKRIDHNFNVTPYKLSACLYCWGFLTPGQKKRHLEHQAYHVTPPMFKNEEHFIKLCQINGKYIQNHQTKEIKVALFNEQCLNVDYSVFGDPLPGEDNYPKLPYDNFRPRQVHAWLTKKSLPLDDNPHTSENSGIPLAKIKNASLKEMLNRIEYWHKKQDRTNQRVFTEIQMLKEENQDLRDKVQNFDWMMQKMIQFIMEGQNLDQNQKQSMQQILDNYQKQLTENSQFNNEVIDVDKLAIQSAEQSKDQREVIYVDEQGKENDQIFEKEKMWMSLNPEDSPLSDLDTTNDT